jgi:hypothetical protein
MAACAVVLDPRDMRGPFVSTAFPCRTGDVQFNDVFRSIDSAWPTLTQANAPQDIIEGNTASLFINGTRVGGMKAQLPATRSASIETARQRAAPIHHVADPGHKLPGKGMGRAVQAGGSRPPG